MSLGVPSVWLLDPLGKKAYVVDAALGFHEVTEQIATTDGKVVFSLEEVFSESEDEVF